MAKKDNGLPDSDELKEGALSKQLDIPEKKDIPMDLLKKIKNADIGETIENPTSKGKQSIKVTKKMKKRANLAVVFKKSN